jgi:hypothetical protein
MTNGKAFIRASDHADTAVGFLEIFHEPVDGVPAIGGIVGARIVVARAERRRGHEVGALGAVLAAHVLIDTDVSGAHEILVGEG